MKALVITLILLFLMLTLIVWNYIYINEVFERMQSLLDSLPDVTDPACAAHAAMICDTWETVVDTVGLSVSYTIVDRVSEQAATLQACASCEDIYGFHTAEALLRDALGDMRRLEDFSIGNLL